MRRLCSWMLVLAFLFCGAGLASEKLHAVEVAERLAEYISEMENVRAMPLENGEENRAIWQDGRGDVKCALIVYSDAEQADAAVLEETTRDTAVRAVGNCALYLNRDLGAEAMLDYRLALAEILGKTVDDSDPDYILNESTRKFHLPQCGAVDDMKEQNKYAYTGDREDLIRSEYKACKICKP